MTNQLENTLSLIDTRHCWADETTGCRLPPPTAATEAWPSAVTGWYTRRGITVAEDLDRLHGPTTRATSLPLAIEASHRTAYDFGEAHQRAEAYRVVLREALTQDDLVSWLDRDELVRIWPDLYLPRDIRAAWQARHPVLAARGTGPHGPQP